VAKESAPLSVEEKREENVLVLTMLKIMIGGKSE
jgi:hypothetical protein